MPQAQTTTITRMLSIQASPLTAAIRTASWNDQEYTVVPCVALVEGVLWPANAPSPELALAEEFGRFPAGWNGKPVVLNHPQDDDGNPVSANSPDILTKYAFGQIFNTVLDGDKLKMELWINNARVTALGGEFVEIVDKLKSGDSMVEVSTGLFTMSEMSSGKHGEAEYHAIWRNIVPDHLAVLSEGTIGACSVSGGCGAPRINNSIAYNPVMRAMALNVSEEHVHAHDTTIVESECACKGACSKCAEAHKHTHRTLFSKLQHKMSSLFKMNASLNTRDLQAAVTIAINALETDYHYNWIVALYVTSENAGEVVYEHGYDGAMIRRNFSVSGSAVTISSEFTLVRPETQFVPVTIVTNAAPPIQAEELIMDKATKINAIIANAGNSFSEADRPVLEAMESATLDKLMPPAGSVQNVPLQKDLPAAHVPATNANAATTTTTAGVAEPAKQQTTAEYIANAPQEVRQILNRAMTAEANRRTALVKGIMANKHNTFTETQLMAKDSDELTMLAKLASGGTEVVTNSADDFSGAFPINNSSMAINSGGPTFTPAPDVFAHLKKQA